LADDRTLDQKRADVLLDLLCGGATEQATAPRCRFVVDLETLIGLQDRVADIPGWGPVVSDVARQALTKDETGRLRVRVVDGDDAVDVTTRRPNAAQRRSVRHRHPTCVFPGCRLPARRADLDGSAIAEHAVSSGNCHLRAKRAGHVELGSPLPVPPSGEGRRRLVARLTPSMQFPPETATCERSEQATSPLGITYIVKRRGP
jgi:hypothetical protein